MYIEFALKLMTETYFWSVKYKISIEYLQIRPVAILAQPPSDTTRYRISCLAQPTPPYLPAQPT